MNNQALIVFLKYPKLGQVKTRLARDIGKEKAAQIYRLLADRVTGVVSRFQDEYNVDLYVFYSSPEAEVERLKECFYFPASTCFVRQEEGDLGYRMLMAFKQVFDLGYERVAIVGTDIPDIKVRHLRALFESLDDRVITVGPSVDGGYYALGMKKPLVDIFSGITFSTKEVLAQTIHAAQNLSLQVHQIEKLRDVDNIADLSHYPDLFHIGFG